MRSRRLALAAFALATVLATTACGQETTNGAGRDDAVSSTRAPGVPRGVGPTEAAQQGAEDGRRVRLRSVKVTERSAFDRVVFRFDGPVTKAFGEYLDALREPGGREIPLAGRHRLVLVFVGVAPGGDVTVDPRRTATVREVRAAEVFEGEMSVGIGVDSEGRNPAGYRLRLDGATATVDIARAGNGR